jgi:hypothetical protein
MLQLGLFFQDSAVIVSSNHVPDTDHAAWEMWWSTLVITPTPRDST